MPSEASERWLAISERFPIGPKRRNSLLRSAEPTEDVESGQLRQAYWRDVSVVIVIDSVDVESAQARVFPATLEPGVENEAAVIIEGEVSPLHGAVAVWPDTVASVPFAALGARIAAVPNPLLRIVKDAVSTTSATAGVRRGHTDPPIGSGADIAIADLFDALDVLKTAPQLRTVVDATSITPPEIALPHDLVRELLEPRWRPYIGQRATDGDETRARMQIAQEVYQLTPPGAGQRQENWRQHIKTILATPS